ncbi:MAG: CRISPR-associated protein Csx19 [Methanothrix sp.]|jgi:CRISPR-associated protein (TIGR03984 family)|nr:CRISPR-associated protein Csx19 [Methanothrix sp.]
MSSQIKRLEYAIEPVIFPPDLKQIFPTWLSQQFQEQNLRWLLAYADDGVIWGEMREDGLHLSSKSFSEVSPPLRFITLKEARLFNENAEIHLWNNGVCWHGILVKDGVGSDVDCYDESYLLWGTDKEKTNDGFALVRQGSEGLCHAPPVMIGEINGFNLILKVRHFLDYDSDGQAYVAFSRLVSLYCRKEE